MLGDLEDPRAIPVLLAKLKYVDPDPVPGTSRLLTNLVRMFSANALGKLRAAQAAPPIQGLVATANAQDEELVSFAAEALVWLGERAQAGELMKKAQSGVLRLRLIAARSAALFGEPSLAKDCSTLAHARGEGVATVLRPAARRGGPPVAIRGRPARCWPRSSASSASLWTPRAAAPRMRAAGWEKCAIRPGRARARGVRARAGRRRRRGASARPGRSRRSTCSCGRRRCARWTGWRRFRRRKPP